MNQNTKLIIKQTINVYTLLLEYLKSNNNALIIKFIADNNLFAGICYYWHQTYKITYLESNEILKLENSGYISHKLSNWGKLISTDLIKEATEKRIEHLKNLL